MVIESLSCDANRRSLGSLVISTGNQSLSPGYSVLGLQADIGGEWWEPVQSVSTYPAPPQTRCSPVNPAVVFNYTVIGLFVRLWMGQAKSVRDCCCKETIIWSWFPLLASPRHSPHIIIGRSQHFTRCKAREKERARRTEGGKPGGVICYLSSRMVCQCLSPWQVRDAGYVDASVRQEISKSSRAECCSCKNGSRTLKRKMDRQIDFSFETARERLFWAVPFIVSRAQRMFLTPRLRMFFPGSLERQSLLFVLFFSMLKDH